VPLNKEGRTVLSNWTDLELQEASDLEILHELTNDRLITLRRGIGHLISIKPYLVRRLEELEDKLDHAIQATKEGRLLTITSSPETLKTLQGIIRVLESAGEQIEEK